MAKDNGFRKVCPTGNSMCEPVHQPKEDEDYSDLQEQQDREDDTERSNK